VSSGETLATRETVPSVAPVRTITPLNSPFRASMMDWR
jgi:hypothetical protein